jgi:hypothetical protein
VTDGSIFERFSTLRQWLVPNLHQDKPVNRTPLKRDGANLRLFLGAESSYFACDVVTREFRTNIDSRDFTDWLLYEARNVLDNTRTLKRGYVPHSLALGPNDMFCWICEKDYKVNTAFRQAFPSIERFLAFAKSKKMLDRVVSPPTGCSVHSSQCQMFTTSPDCQPGSKLPYFVLLTSDGVCVSSVPVDALDLITKYTTRWGAVCSARHAKEIVSQAIDMLQKRLTQDEF